MWWKHCGTASVNSKNCISVVYIYSVVKIEKTCMFCCVCYFSMMLSCWSFAKTETPSLQFPSNRGIYKTSVIMFDSLWGDYMFLHDISIGTCAHLVPHNGKKLMKCSSISKHCVRIWKRHLHTPNFTILCIYFLKFYFIFINLIEFWQSYVFIHN